MENGTITYYENLHENRTETFAEDMNECEGRLSIQEPWDVLQSFGNNKSPDGLSKEFYVCFLNEINAYLITSLNYSFQVRPTVCVPKTSHDGSG